MNSKKVYLRPRPKFHAGALEDYECGCTHAPYSTLVSTLQTKNIVTSYEAPNKNKNTTLLSVKTIKTYDNKVNGGEKTFARSATMANKQRISPPAVKEDKKEKKWTIKERPNFNASKLEDDNQCGCTHSYYNSVIMDIRTKYQDEFENDSNYVMKKKRIKSTAAVGNDFFDQSYSSKDHSKISKQKSIRRKKVQQGELEDDDDDNVLTNQSGSSKTSVSVKRREIKTPKKKRNQPHAGDEDEEEENLSPSALLQAINDIQEGVERPVDKQGKTVQKSSKINSIENKQIFRAYSSSELPDLQPNPPIGNKTDRIFSKKGIKYNNKFWGYDNDEDKRFAQFGSLTLKKALSSKTPRPNKMPSISGYNTPKSLKGNLEDDEDFDLSSRHSNNMQGSLEDSDYSTSSKKKKKGGATSLADLGSKDKQGPQKSRFGLLPSAKSDKDIDMSGLTPSKTKKYKNLSRSTKSIGGKSKAEFEQNLDLEENEDGGYIERFMDIVEGDTDEKNEQEIGEENRMLEYYQLILKKRIQLYEKRDEENNKKRLERETKEKQEEIMVLIRKMAKNEQIMEAAEEDHEKTEVECRVAAEQEQLDKARFEKLQVKVTEVRKKIEDAKKDIKKLDFKNKTSGKTLNEMEMVKKEFDERDKELEELNKKFAALRQKNYMAIDERIQTSEEDRILTQDFERAERAYLRMFMTPVELEKDQEKMQKQVKNLEGDLKYFENSLKFKKSQAEREYRAQRAAYQKDVEDAGKKEKLLASQNIEVDRLIAINMKSGDRETREVLEYLKATMEDDGPATIGSMSNLEEVPKASKEAKPKLMRGKTMGIAELKIGTEVNLDIEDKEDVSGKSYAMTSRNRIIVKKTKEAEDYSSTSMKLKRSGTVGELVFPEIKSKLVRSIAIGGISEWKDGAKSARIVSKKVEKKEENEFDLLKLQKNISEKSAGDDLLSYEGAKGFKIRTIPSDKGSVKTEMRIGKIVTSQQPDQATEVKKVIEKYNRANSAVANKDKIKAGI